MRKKTWFATRALVCGLAFAQALAAPAWAAAPADIAPQQRASQAAALCLPGTCLADAVVVHRHHRPPHTQPVPRHHHTRHHHHHGGTVVVVRPVRPWVHRPYYGAVVAGVVLGTVIVASSVPPAPSPQVCWYWSNSFQTRGYWDYCKPH
ncbi:hypothetical protein [Rhizobium rhizosphaerae]|uniref:hypothetical protein n=1 Tax=Xaviernesmea rhizosphaerae TaxID=1672749 RepID=UPI00098F93CD|nr:hypothetical protein [Xaviernesmea rhizosphaerae]